METFMQGNKEMILPYSKYILVYQVSTNKIVYLQCFSYILLYQVAACLTNQTWFCVQIKNDPVDY